MLVDGGEVGGQQDGVLVLSSSPFAYCFSFLLFGACGEGNYYVLMNICQDSSMRISRRNRYSGRRRVQLYVVQSVKTPDDDEKKPIQVFSPQPPQHII